MTLQELRDKWSDYPDVYTLEDKEELINDCKEAGFDGFSAVEFSTNTYILNLTGLKAHGLVDLIHGDVYGFVLI